MNRYHSTRLFVMLFTVFVVVGMACVGCKDNHDTAENKRSEEGYSEKRTIAFILGKGTDKIHFGDERAEVIAEFGKPSFENDRLLSYTNLGMDVWLSKKDAKVVMISGGSMTSIEEANRFSGQVNNSVRIGSSRGDVIASLGNPSLSEFQDVDGSAERAEILTYTNFGLQITLKKQQAMLFLFRKVGD